MVELLKRMREVERPIAYQAPFDEVIANDIEDEIDRRIAAHEPPGAP